MMALKKRQQRQRARSAVHRAIRQGLLPPPTSLPCTDCGHLYCDEGPWHEYDHHLGYDEANWLAVQVVCKPCHVKRTIQSDAWKKRRTRKWRWERIEITLPPGYKERLSVIGRGTASAAIVRLVDEHESQRT